MRRKLLPVSTAHPSASQTGCFLLVQLIQPINQYAETCAMGSPARSGRPVALLCVVILVVSSRTLRNTEREFGGRFTRVEWTLDNGPCVTSVVKKRITDHHAHGNGHGHLRVYARLRHMKRTMQEPD